MSKNLTAAEKIVAELGLEDYQFAPGISIKRPSPQTIKAAGVLVDQWDGDTPKSEKQMTDLLKILAGDQYGAVVDFLENFPVEGYPALFSDFFANVMSMVPRDMTEDSIVDEMVSGVETRWVALNPDDVELFNK